MDPALRAQVRASSELVPLFNPRTDTWTEHFEWRGSSIVGTTKTGRATIDLLQINLPERIEHRRLLIEAGVFPP
jgi:hypothetical protein